MSKYILRTTLEENNTPLVITVEHADDNSARAIIVQIRDELNECLELTSRGSSVSKCPDKPDTIGW